MTDRDRTGPTHIHQAFGLTWASDVPLHDFDVSRPLAPGQVPDIVVEQTDALPVTRTGLVPVNRGAVCAEGVRFRWGNQVSFDTYGADRVVWQAGSAWTGQMPQPFFSTLTALLLAWRGMLPMHGSAVEIGGRGYLICGVSGAGKSTLAAGLVALGARLISDDLTVVMQGRDGQALEMVRGRSGIRLVPQIARYFEQSVPHIEPPERRDRKLLVRTTMVPQGQHVPLAGIVLRGLPTEPVATADRAGMVQEQVFRKVWMSALPGRQHREALIRQIAAAVPLFSVERGAFGDRHDFLDQAGKVMERLA